MISVLIRPLEEQDALTSWKWRNDPEVWKYTGTQPSRFITYEIELDWIRKVLADTTCKRFAIIVNDIYVGNVQLTNIDNEKAIFHIFIGNKEYWGMGIAKIATTQILGYAQRVLKLKKILLEVNINNIAAIKTYKKVGFRPTASNHDILSMECNLENFTTTF